jgi:thiamine-monophosphate kinase
MYGDHDLAMALNERDLIENIFAPLTRQGDGSIGLTDDAAFLPPNGLCDLVITQDSLISEVHFRANDSPKNIARKSLRVNLSDLAAKGAVAHSYLLSIALPSNCKRCWVEEFAAGLASDQTTYGVKLIGGDTVRSPHALMITITALGYIPRGKMVRRVGANPGDNIYVTGTLGDSTLGLAVLNEVSPALQVLDEGARLHLCNRYFLPQPRTALAPVLLDHASAAMDISDGLLGDLTLLINASNVSAKIDLNALPISPSASAAIANDESLRKRAYTGGDDYEILAAVSPEAASSFEDDAARVGVSVTCIGHIVVRDDLLILQDSNEQAIKTDRLSFSHF